MAFGINERAMPQGRTGSMELDAGLRKYMLGVYNYMASAVVLTGLVALAVSQSPYMLNLIFGTPLKWVAILAPLGMVFFLSARIHKMQASTAQAMFWVYAALVGVSLASIFVVYTGESVARVFFISAGAFAGLSLYGYTTKKDLSGFGTFLMMGLIGLVIAMVVNIFLASTMMQWIISVVGLLIFAGLTAYDTQQIKMMYYAGDSSEDAQKKSIMGALRLYLDFLNIFLFLLQFLGNRE
ncbi:BAX inhibitor (BI)-1/YccA family protein [Alphaproteobacteria bacterium HT1-32]|nr:BAX inhibitor (BI)-1/YccA family protein [Alphaproteobacteria bacterium HT1-32]|tara:strand:- start:47236 stop:47952 length:717 start_codon:yes stop_codon:yes gene_type:complete